MNKLLKNSILLVCLLLFINTNCMAQMLTFDQVQSLRTKSLADVETFLTAKNWSMTDASAEEESKLGAVTFGYKVDEFDSEKASSWINFIHNSDNNSYNRISIQLNTSALYTAYMARLTANGYKLLTSEIVDGGIEKVYQNKSTTCIINTSTVEGNYTKKTSYSFFFLTNYSYSLNFE
jgi:hypothetical protein